MSDPFIKAQGMSVFWLLMVIAVCVPAQEISGVTIDEATSIPNTPISMRIDFDLGDAQNPYCGLEINFGDGQTQSVRAGLNGAQDFPMKLTHSYANPGKYQVKAEGKTLIRGFKSASACRGSVKQSLVTIVDQAAESAKQELVIKEKSLAAKQIELQEFANKMEREQGVQAAKALKLRELELEQMQRAIDQKERELELKQRELNLKEHQAQSKHSYRENLQSQVPIKPNPAPTPNRVVIDGF